MTDGRRIQRRDFDRFVLDGLRSPTLSEDMRMSDPHYSRRIDVVQLGGIRGIAPMPFAPDPASFVGMQSVVEAARRREEQRAAAAESLIGIVIDAYRDAFAPLVAACKTVAKALRDAHLVVGAEPVPTDPRKRALWMKQRRGTGPPTPAAWHRRRIPSSKAKACRARGPVNHQHRRSYEFRS